MAPQEVGGYVPKLVESQLDWINLRSNEDPSGSANLLDHKLKFWKKAPFIPITLGLTFVSFAYGLYHIDNTKKTIIGMKGRIFFQAATLALFSVAYVSDRSGKMREHQAMLGRRRERLEKEQLEREQLAQQQQKQ